MKPLPANINSLTSRLRILRIVSIALLRRKLLSIYYLREIRFCVSLYKGMQAQNIGYVLIAVAIVTIASAVFLLICLILQRVLNRLFPDKSESVASCHPHPNENRENGIVYEDTICLKVTSPKGDIKTLKWSDIEEVYVFKRDLFAIDMICLSFKKLGKEEYYEINEDMVGYHDLLEVLPKRLCNYDPEWFSSVVYPAFKPNCRMIWNKPAEDVKLAALPV